MALAPFLHSLPDSYSSLFCCTNALVSFFEKAMNHFFTSPKWKYTLIEQYDCLMFFFLIETASHLTSPSRAHIHTDSMVCLNVDVVLSVMLLSCDWFKKLLFLQEANKKFVY